MIHPQSDTPKKLNLPYLIVVLAFVIVMSVILISLRGVLRNQEQIPDTPSAEPEVVFSPLDFGDEMWNAGQFFRAGNYAEAENTLRTLYLFYPESAAVMQSLANVLSVQKKHEEAEKLYQLCLARYPDHPGLRADYENMRKGVSHE